METFPRLLYLLTADSWVS